MNKGELIEKVASDLGSTKTAASKAIESVIKCIAEGIKEKDTVTISGFGTFSRKLRAARTGVNPSTGEPLQIKASKTVAFKPSRSLKDTLS
ncbi:MAG: HU family DNA-binding protein [Planctomycetes bacterium]|nr:HU family DNA-binding protein [Planctomycetota bacterium]